MDLTDVQTLITGQVTDIGTTALAIFTAVIGLGVAVYVVRWGFRKAKHGLNGKV